MRIPCSLVGFHVTRRRSTTDFLCYKVRGWKLRWGFGSLSLTQHDNQSQVLKHLFHQEVLIIHFCIWISLPVLRKDPEIFLGNWRLKQTFLKCTKKLILKNLLLICCNFSFNFNSKKKKNPSNKHFLNDYCLIIWQTAPETLAPWAVIGRHPSLSHFAWEKAEGCEFSSRTEHLLALHTGNSSHPSGAFSVTTDK